MNKLLAIAFLAVASIGSAAAQGYRTNQEAYNATYEDMLRQQQANQMRQMQYEQQRMADQQRAMEQQIRSQQIQYSWERR